MKRRMYNSIAIALMVLLSMITFAPTAQGQQPRRRAVGETGLVEMPPTLLLRIVVSCPDLCTGEIFMFRRMSYTQETCNGGVCKHTLASQTTSGPIGLDGTEAASFDTVFEDLSSGASGVRVVVLSNRSNARVVAQLIDRTTGKVESFMNIEALP